MTLSFVSHFPAYRKNQVELLALLVLALIGAKDVRHASLAERCPGNAQTASVIRQIERFFHQHPLCPLDVARLVLALLAAVLAAGSNSLLNFASRSRLLCCHGWMPALKKSR